MILENLTLGSFSQPIQLFKRSKKVIESLTLSNVELDFSDPSTFSEVLLFLKRLQSTVIELRLHFSIKPNIDLIRGFQKVQKLEITSPGWYVEIANSKITFPEVQTLKLTDFNIEIFGKNMFVSFFKKFSYVEEILIEGNVVQNYSRFGTFFGKKLKQVHFDIENEQLAGKTMEFLTIIKGIELHKLTFVIHNAYDVEILDKIVMVHATLNDIEVISTRGYLPSPHLMIRSCEISLREELMDVFNALDFFSGLNCIAVHFPWKQNHVQINCFFGHDFMEPHLDVTTLKLSGFNKDCLTCFANMTATYPNLEVFEYTSATQIEMHTIEILGSNLPQLKELTLIYKNYEKSCKPGFAKYFEEWPAMPKLTKLRLEPISWQWSSEGLINLGNKCPLLENVHFDGGADIDDTFLRHLMTKLHFLQHLTIGDVASRASDIPNLSFLFTSEVVEDVRQNMELVENFRQPCPRLKELRLLTCSLDMSLKLRLFQHYKMLRAVQDRKTLLTSKEFHARREVFRQEIHHQTNEGRKRTSRFRKFLRNCLC